MSYLTDLKFLFLSDDNLSFFTGFVFQKTSDCLLSTLILSSSSHFSLLVRSLLYCLNVIRECHSVMLSPRVSVSPSLSFVPRAAMSTVMDTVRRVLLHHARPGCHVAGSKGRVMFLFLPTLSSSEGGW